MSPLAPSRRPRALVAVVLALLAGLLAGAVAPSQAPAIVAGAPLSVGDAPWIVQVRDREGFLCSASLIGPRIVLTAAHCAEGHVPVEVVLGRQQSAGTDGVVVAVARRLADPAWPTTRRAVMRFPTRDITRDVALLELARPVTEVAPVALAGPGDAAFLSAGRRATVAGWGATRGKLGVLTPTRDEPLRSTVVPLSSARACAREAGGTRATGALCSGGTRRPFPGVCQGDSGGPLYRATPAGVVLLGVNHGHDYRGCGAGRSSYASVQGGPPRAWIDRHIGPDGLLRGGAPVATPGR